jgi:CelD/BcsL family acetyltransferase involved in cellulose biosynthesis
VLISYWGGNLPLYLTYFDLSPNSSNFKRHIGPESDEIVGRVAI